MNFKQLVKKKLLDRFWASDLNDSYLETIHYKAILPFENLVPDFCDKVTNDTFGYLCKNYPDREFIFKTKYKSVICPYTGHVICGLRNILKNNFISPEYIPYPSVSKRLKNYYCNHSIDRAIMFDSEGLLGNYYHFLIDAIPKLYIIDEYEYLKGLPLIVRSLPINKPFFQYMLKKNIFNGRPIIELRKEDKWTHVKELYLVRALRNNKESLLKTINYCMPEDKLRSDRKYERIYIKRSERTGRFILNCDEIENFLKKNNFVIINPDNCSFEEQIIVFRNSKYIIGAHGAGLTNLIFAYKNNPRILEISPNNRVTAFYYFLANTLNCYYDCVLGTSVDRYQASEGGVSIEMNKFKLAFDKLLAN